jgi:protein TonB
LPPLPAFAAPPLLELKARSVAPAPKQAVAAREKAQPRPEQPRGPILLLPGIGEGAQKMPRYPRLARERGQEGEIRAEITVDKNGRMTDVRLSSPCRWELLNREVLRVIREEWRFSHGEERRYTMTFQFLLREKKP